MITTNTRFNFTSAENETWSQTDFDGTNGSILTHKATGRQVYQMSWLNADGKMSEKLEGAERESAKAFWAELYALKEERTEEARKEAQAWRNSPKGKADTEAMERHEQLMRDMDRENSDY